MDWRPIETAPKAGDILIFDVAFGPRVANWNGDGPVGYWSDLDGHCYSQATHWMPLPAPPKDRR